MKQLAALSLATAALCFGATAHASVTQTAPEAAPTRSSSGFDLSPATVGAVLRGVALDATLSTPHPLGADAFMPPSGVPEPAEIGLLGVGVAGLWFLRRRRKAARS